MRNPLMFGMDKDGEKKIHDIFGRTGRPDNFPGGTTSWGRESKTGWIKQTEPKDVVMVRLKAPRVDREDLWNSVDKNILMKRMNV